MMSLKKKLSYNLIIQAIGPLLSFFTIFLIAKIGGAEIQGRYASITAWINLVVVIGTFGFPQSFIYLINKLNISPKVLFHLSYYYSLGFIILLVPIVLILFNQNLLDTIVISNSGQIIILSVPITILTFHGLLRGIYLTHNQSILFGTFSILPACLLFVFILIGILLNNYNFQLIYLFSSIPVLLIALVLIKSVLKNLEKYTLKNFPWAALFNHGTNSFLQALFFALQPIIAYWFINKYIGSILEIGYFNLGLFLVQGFLVPISMVAPLLFEHWTKNEDQNVIAKFTNLKIFVIELLIGGTIAFLLNYLIPIVFGSEYIPSVRIAQILLFITPVVFHIRILMPAIHSKGYPIFNTYSGLARLMLFSCLSYLWMLTINQELVGLAFCWTISELFGAFITIVFFNISNKKVNLISRT